MKDSYDMKKLRKKKKRINSRSKGNSYEREVCKLLNERFETNEFSRTPGSGAFATTHNLPEHLKIYGDVITPIKFKYCIECKKGYNKEDILSLINYSSDLWKFLEQTEKEAKKAKKEPLLVFRQDRKKAIAIARKGCFPVTKPVLRLEDYIVYLFDDILKLKNEYWFLEDLSE